MVERAQEKMGREQASLRLTYATGDAKDLRVGERFDSVLMMFSVFGYQLGNEDVIAALTAAKEHLSADGLFVFDVLGGHTVITQKPALSRWCTTPTIPNLSRF